MKNISVREAYDWLRLLPNSQEGLSQNEWDQLLLFLEREYGGSNISEISYQKLRFINIVGIIQLPTVRIEILPKIALEENSELKNRIALLTMLSVTKKLPIQFNEKTESTYVAIL